MTCRSTVVLIAALTAAGVAVNAAAQAPVPEKPATEATAPKPAGKQERHASHQAGKAAKHGQQSATHPAAPIEQKGQAAPESTPAE